MTVIGVVVSFSTTSGVPFNVNNFAGVGRVAFLSPTTIFSGDGGKATAASLTSPYGMWMTTASEELLIADNGNNRVRKVSLSTDIISEFAESAITGQGIKPWHMCGDTAGNVYVINYNSPSMKKIDAGGIISSFAGTGAFGNAGDGGQATSATFQQQYHCAVDSNADVYISGTAYNLRKVTISTGIVNVFAGSGASSGFGQSGQRTSIALKYPGDVFVDTNGDIYFPESTTGIVRKVAYLSDQVTTYSGVSSYSNSGEKIVVFLFYLIIFFILKKKLF